MADTNYNFLQPNGFRVLIERLPGVVFNCQLVTIPTFSSDQNPEVSTPFNDYNVVGTESSFGNLDITFIVDEEAENYKQLYSWMKGIYFPVGWGQFQVFVSKNRGILPKNPLHMEQILVSDLTLMILDSDSNPSATIKFVDAFPISIGSLPFSTTVSSDFAYLTAMASFRYTYYDFV